MSREDWCPFVATYAKDTATNLRTFWCKCISLISLIPCNDPAIVHFTFSITFLSHSTSALG